MKIPQYEQQVNTPSAPQYNNIADVRTDSLGKLADGLGQVYEAKLKADEEAKKTAIFQADTSVKMELQKAKYDMLEKIKNGGDYASAEQEYQALHGQIVNKYSSAFDIDKTGNTRARYMSSYQADGVDGLLTVRDAVNQRRKADTTASANNMMDMLKQEYSFEQDPKKREIIVSKMTETVAGLSATGVIPPDEGKMKIRENIASAEQDRLKLFMQNNSSDLSLAELEASKQIVGVDYYTQARGIIMGEMEKEASADKVTSSVMGNGDLPNFDLAVKSVFKEEGMAYVADDAGRGPTIYGINSESNKEEFNEIMKLRNEGKVSESIQMAKQVYKQKYWDAIGADNLPPSLAYVAMDTAVNMGAGTAKELIEKSGGNVQVFNELRKQKYQQIAQANPSKAKYLNGWLARADRVAGAVTKGDFVAKQEDVDRYFQDNIVTSFNNGVTDQVKYEQDIVDVATKTGYVPSAIKQQASRYLSVDPSTFSNSDAETAATVARVISNISEQSYSLKESQLPDDIVTKANILNSRIEAGIAPKDAMMDMFRVTKDKTQMEIYKDSIKESQKIVMGQKVNKVLVDKPDLPSYANSDFMQSYAVHRSFGAEPDEARDLANKELSKRYKEFNGTLLKDPVTAYDNRFGEQSWVEHATTQLKERGINIPNGVKVGIVADPLTDKERSKYINPEDRNKVGYTMVWIYDDNSLPVPVVHNGMVQRIYAKPELQITSTAYKMKSGVNTSFDTEVFNQFVKDKGYTDEFLANNSNTVIMQFINSDYLEKSYEAKKSKKK